MEQKLELLSIGSEGPSVARLQTLLQLLGYYKGKIDGIFDLHLSHVVKSFQADFGLKIDGVVGEKTWTALENAVDEALLQKPGLKFFGVTIPWWLVAVLGGAGIAGVIELIRWLIRRKS